MADADEHLQTIVGKIAAGAAAAAPNGAGAAIVAGLAAGGLEAVERLTGPTLVKLFQSPADRQLAQAWASCEAAELEEEKERLAARIDEILKNTQLTVTATNNIIALFLEWRRARGNTSDPRKARLLMAAFVNAFNADAYRDGMNATLLQIIGKLDYGDMFFLKSLLPNGHGIEPAAAARFDPSHMPQNATAPTALGGPGPNTLARWHADRLLNAGLCWVNRNGHDYHAFRVQRTAVGERLLELVGENAFRDAENI